MLLVVQTLLRIDSNDDHPYHKPVSALLDFLLGGAGMRSDCPFVATVVRQYRDLQSAPAPRLPRLKLMAGKSRTPVAPVAGTQIFLQAHLQVWAAHSVYEQVQLLHVLLYLLFDRWSASRDSMQEVSA